MLDAIQNITGIGLLTVFAFVFVISIVVVIHELGHFFAGRFFGIHAEVFSMGFGPTLFAVRDRAGTIWRLAAFPLGGYVRFMGDAGAASEPDQAKLDEMREKLGPEAERCFHFKPVWQRAIVVAAGPIANFILAIVIFTALNLTFGERYLEPIVAGVEAGSPAAIAGFQVDDRIEMIAGQPIETFSDIATHLVWRPGETVTITVRRQGALLDIPVAPALTERTDRFGGERQIPTIGINSPGTSLARRMGPLEAFGAANERVWTVVSITGKYVGRIVTGRAPANMLNGPIGIVTMSGQIANASVEDAPSAGIAITALLANLLQLAGLFSIGLGLVNLLPIPMLDGGHLVYYGYEAVAGRPLSARVQAIGFRVGLALVLGMMLVASVNDLSYLRGLFS